MSEKVLIPENSSHYIRTHSKSLRVCPFLFSLLQKNRHWIQCKDARFCFRLTLFNYVLLFKTNYVVLDTPHFRLIEWIHTYICLMDKQHDLFERKSRDSTFSSLLLIPLIWLTKRGRVIDTVMTTCHDCVYDYSLMVENTKCIDTQLENVSSYRKESNLDCSKCTGCWVNILNFLRYKNTVMEV